MRLSARRSTTPAAARSLRRLRALAARLGTNETLGSCQLRCPSDWNRRRPPTIVGPLETEAGWVDNATATDIRKLVARYIPGGVTFTGGDRDDRNIAAARILAAMQPQEVIASLSLGGRHTIAARIRELHEMAGDGAPDETPHQAHFPARVGALLHEPTSACRAGDRA